uniref:Uncharacterized protein n=1 Tax=Anolis carolinensis TaxID=28377 RepID=H9GAE4_ANOCA
EILQDSHPRNVEEAGRSYSEEDFEYHRQSSHHIHHPLSSHLPSEGRRKKGKKKAAPRPQRASLPGETPIIPEEEAEGEEEEEGEEEAGDTAEEAEQSPPQRRPQGGSRDGVQFFLPEDDAVDRQAEGGYSTPGQPGPAVCAVLTRGVFSYSPDEEDPEGLGAEGGSSGRLPSKPQPGHRSYNLNERRRIGSQTGIDQARLPKVPTDESEAQTLASVDLDYMKSHRFEDVPGVRRHLVRKSTKGQVVHLGKDRRESSTRTRKTDRQPHEVFVELNELIVDKNQEMQWKETARWIKFEEDVEEETDRWGKPHVASLSFRSLLELRRTLSHGAVLLDLDQKTLPGVAHQVVEQMIISDQIRAEDRANVLRALLLKHSHPSDEKEFSFPRNISAGSLGSLLSHHHSTNHIGDSAEPAVTDPLIGGHMEQETRVDIEKEKEVPSPVVSSISRSKSKHELKLLEKIPENAEATVVLVGSVDFLDQPTMAFVRLQEAAQLDAVLEVPIPVRFLFVLLGPQSANMDYHEIGRSISTLMSDKQFHEAAYLADDRQDLLHAINEFLDCSVVLPPSEVQGEELLRSVANFQREMLRRREEQERRQFLGPEAEPKSPEEKGGPGRGPGRGTKIAYPLLILYPLLWPGPVLLCISVLLLLVVYTVLIVFNLLFVLYCYIVFLREMLGLADPPLLGQIFQAHPLNNCLRANTTDHPMDPEGNWTTGNTTAFVGELTGQPNTALLSLVLMGGTFFIGFFLRKFKNSRFFPGRVRRMIGDFGVPIAILVMVLVDYNIRDTYTQKLSVPRGLSVTDPDKRGWVINPLGEVDPFPVWMMVGCGLPAMLVFILIFMETQITTLIISKKERKLRKGSGFHLDLLIIVALGGFCALFGLPWLTAATVRSVTHTNALTVMSKAVAPGDKPKVQEVREQRVTGFLVAFLVGLSIVISDLLRKIPLSVLFGIFLYMGITSLNGIQFYERLKLLLMPAKHHPEVSYVKKVRTVRMHLFTLQQLSCLAVLGAVIAHGGARWVLSLNLHSSPSPSGCGLVRHELHSKRGPVCKCRPTTSPAGKPTATLQREGP